MNDTERMRILEMLEAGKITAAEAVDLLNALGAGSRPTGGPERHRFRGGDGPPHGGRRFRVRVTDRKTGRERANVAVPLGFAGLGLGMAHRFHAHPQVDELLDAVRSGKRGTVFDVANDHGDERVEIIIE